MPWLRPRAPSALDLSCLALAVYDGSWPSAYQSTSNLMIYPQTTFPFELLGLPFLTAEAAFPG
jgi:hypothetical protein